MAYDGEAVVEEGGYIVAEEMPFREGDPVEMVLWPSVVEASPARKKGGIVESLQELAEWTRQRYPEAKPLSDEALSRDSLYED